MDQRRRFAGPGLLVAGCAWAMALALNGCGNDDGGGQQARGEAIRIETVSTRADLVTGGDVLVKVTVPAGVMPTDVRVQLDGADVTGSLTVDASTNTLNGLVSGLPTNASANGSASTLSAFTTNETARVGTLTVTNYPITGPVLSGPHKTPYECRTVQSALGSPLDADCSAARRVDWFYRASDNTFKAMSDPTARPADLVTTTTNAGVTAPFIVRVEGGTNNRAIYRIAILDNPTAATVASSNASTNFTPTTAWNRKAIFSFGGGCGNQYNQGQYTAPEALDATSLGLGFAFVISSELYNQVHCNPHLQGEALMMLKEYFIDHYGKPRWVVGTGGSGGAIQQYLITQLYPGLLDGIQPGLSFPDSMMEDILGCGLMKRNVYPRNTSRWTTAKQTAAEGYTAGTCTTWNNVYGFTGLIDAINGIATPALATVQGGNIPCGLADQSKRFDPVTNPTGARCDIYTSNINLLTADASGVARRPFDNIGVQYGLVALNAGTLSADEFLELNENIGGYDRNGQPIAARSTADPLAIRNAYRGGLKNSFTGGMTFTPTITIRSNGTGAGDIHARLQDFIVRGRLQAANGRADNQIILTTGPAASAAAQLNITTYALDIMNRWLDAITADAAPTSIEKTVRLKPADAVDTCWDVDGTRFAELAGPGANRCNAIYPVATSPTINAGAPLAQDVFKCQLKPIDTADYAVAFSPAQQSRLAAAFPSGVCDWAKPDAGKTSLQGTYLKLPLS